MWKTDSVRVSTSLRLASLSSSPASSPADRPRYMQRQDVAETLGIANLSEDVAAALAGDVEYRLWELIEVRVSPRSRTPAQLGLTRARIVCRHRNRLSS